MFYCQHMPAKSSWDRGVQATHYFISIAARERSADEKGNLCVENFNERRDCVSWNQLEGVVFYHDEVRGETHCGRTCCWHWHM